MDCDAYDELYDGDDHDPDDDVGSRNRLMGRHTERECRFYRDEMRLRTAQYKVLGCGREYRQLAGAQREALPEPARKALAPRRRLPGPKKVPTTAPPEATKP